MFKPQPFIRNLQQTTSSALPSWTKVRKLEIQTAAVLNHSLFNFPDMTFDLVRFFFQDII